MLLLILSLSFINLKIYKNQSPVLYSSRVPCYYPIPFTFTIEFHRHINQYNRKLDTRKIYIFTEYNLKTKMWCVSDLYRSATIWYVMSRKEHWIGNKLPCHVYHAGHLKADIIRRDVKIEKCQLRLWCPWKGSTLMCITKLQTGAESKMLHCCGDARRGVARVGSGCVPCACSQLLARLPAVQHTYMSSCLWTKLIFIFTHYVWH